MGEGMAYKEGGRGGGEGGERRAMEPAVLRLGKCNLLSFLETTTATRAEPVTERKRKKKKEKKRSKGVPNHRFLSKPMARFTFMPKKGGISCCSARHPQGGEEKVAESHGCQN